MPAPLACHADPPGDLPPLLLIHGLLTSARHWLPNMALSRHFRLIRVDLPGHGQSADPATADDAHPDTIIAGLEQVRIRLGIASWHVCGASFGGGLALRYALDHPAACRSVTFTNANSALRDHWSATDLQAQADLVARIRTGGAEALRALRYHPAHARRFAPEIYAALVKDAERVAPETMALFQEEAIPRLSQRHRLGSLQRPCLLINGALERRFQTARDWLSQTHSGIAIVDLAGGHSINIECPDAFGTTLKAFLSRSEAE